ncbi:hypothetical protein KUCAC02_015123 [Chaenocephalus aceratus]|uniref:Uncharacterized protein n=1 Tax=Chaenocephalus aceratus TaxID=36190 RepID=A0ACB9XYC6_CHAAC|nr:hypothetical protein KUCAC02_015123 [Chaenocephalus aceratus]
MSGDGLLYEVINGLLDRPDWEEAVRTPLGILPGGSGNALAASIHHYSGAPPVFSEELLLSCGFLLCQRLVTRMDLVSVHLSSSPRLFSFLSLAWGFVADVDNRKREVPPPRGSRSLHHRHAGAAGLSARLQRHALPNLPVAEDDGEGGHPPLQAPPSRDPPCQNSFHNSCHSTTP